MWILESCDNKILLQQVKENEKSIYFSYYLFLFSRLVSLSCIRMNTHKKIGLTFSKIHLLSSYNVNPLFSAKLTLYKDLSELLSRTYNPRLYMSSLYQHARVYSNNHTGEGFDERSASCNNILHLNMN